MTFEHECNLGLASTAVRVVHAAIVSLVAVRIALLLFVGTSGGIEATIK